MDQEVRTPDTDPPATRRRTSGELLETILPALVARLGTSRLAELEVRTGDWRVRLRRETRPAAERAASHDGSRLPPATGAGDAAEGLGLARSPAVGYFSPAPDLIVGRPVRAGDALGRVDVLGVSHDVSSPVDGAVGRIFVEPGQAVEYGQELAQVDPGPAQS